ncbi:sigma factor-like helix-turn-helix DNA-binding protein [Saccharomonospora sp. NPDC046836]|uniref:sigma factor-like helix-turn-helix DNA-binding protein n=1 Tax=Saccharomonospora sp. NPDC046836 TaxID=3156921 RepID=UPI0033E07F17
MDIAAVQRIEDPHARALRISELIDEQQALMSELTRLRREAIQDMQRSGINQSDIAKMLGMTRSRVSQILAGSGRKPERALLSGGDSVTIVVPVEKAPYPEGKERPVVHREDAEFIERMTTLAQGVGLEVATEYAGPGDFIDLNRDGLVITCGPRQSPWLEQALSADGKYGFARDDAGWYLEDKASGQKFRSPEDSGLPQDYGYLGTLPRPDGNGFWLYAAGIHAAGSRGAAKYLSENLSGLYKAHKNILWSCLVSCTFDPETRELTKSEPLTEVQRRGAVPSSRK